MPNLDGTGPQGKGSKTGRGLGKCRPKQQSPEQTATGRQNRGAGRGKGLGRRMK